MKMASLKLVLAALLVSSVYGGAAYAQSSHRGDERIQNNRDFRLGDSSDLQADQMVIDEMKVCNDNSVDKKEEQANVIIHKIDYNKPSNFKRLIKNSI